MRELAEYLLELYDLEGLIEINDMTAEDVVVYLLEAGLINEPEYILQSHEVSSEVEEG